MEQRFLNNLCVGETGLHVCFLVPTSTHLELAKMMIRKFPKVTCLGRSYYLKHKALKCNLHNKKAVPFFPYERGEFQAEEDHFCDLMKAFACFSNLIVS